MKVDNATKIANILNNGKSGKGRNDQSKIEKKVTADVTDEIKGRLHKEYKYNPEEAVNHKYMKKISIPLVIRCHF